MGRSRRQAGHTGANAITIGYLLAVAAEVVGHLPDPAPTWLVVHLLLLGAATNAIVTWSSHFAGSLLQQPPLPAPVTLARLVLLNAGVVGVLVGVSEGWRVTAVVAAAVVGAVLVVHLLALVRTVQAARARRFATTIRFYWAAAVAAVLAVAAGVVLALGDVSPPTYERTFVAHVHLAVLGWVTLTVLGTEFTLWPIALRTRMVPGLEQAAKWCLTACVTGLAAAVAGLLTWTRPLAIAGLLVFVAGAVVFLVPFARTAVQRTPRDPATLMLAASTVWLAAGLVADAVALTRRPDPFAFAGDLVTIVPWWVTGFVVQVLLGALSYLVPVLLGGPPPVGRRTAAALNRWSLVRVTGLNVGAVLIAVGGTRALARAGWVLVAAAVVVFAALVGAATTARYRQPAA